MTKSQRTTGRPAPGGSGTRPPTRQQRRAAARTLQADARRRQQQRARRRLGALLAAAVLAAAGLAAFAATRPHRAGSTTLPGLQTGPPPWGANTADLAARLRAIGLPPLAPMEGTAVHIHQHLDLFVDGRPVTVPALIGIDPSVGFAPLHTHDASGVIHVESPTVRSYTLGQFFAVWGVRFTPSCLGGDCAGGGRQLKVWVNGVAVRATRPRSPSRRTRRSWSPTGPQPSCPGGSRRATGSRPGSSRRPPRGRVTVGRSVQW
jgi:hypothetical protein